MSVFGAVDLEDQTAGLCAVRMGRLSADDLGYFSFFWIAAFNLALGLL